MVRTEPLSRSIWSRARWLVVAPHPDDETLGAGALIAHTASQGHLGGVSYLTDGTGSHPEGTAGLANARRIEARRAVRRLAGKAVAIDWIGWRDAHPYPPGGARFACDAQRIAAVLRHRRIDAVAVTALEESHCDHVAAYRLAVEAVRRARRPVALFTYHVWSLSAGGRARRIRTRPMPAGRRRSALQAHRSQLTALYGAGFRLTPSQQRMPAADLLTLQRVRP